MSGRDIEQMHGAAKIQESSAFQRKERRPFRGHLSHNTYGQVCLQLSVYDVKTVYKMWKVPFMWPERIVYHFYITLKRIWDFFDRAHFIALCDNAVGITISQICSTNVRGFVVHILYAVLRSTEHSGKYY